MINLIEGTHTLRNVRRDFPEWHLGRSPYVFWGLDVDFPAIRELLARADEHMAGLLLNNYQRQPHVTLDLCGFPAAQPQRDDEFGPAFLAQQCRALSAGQVRAFALEVGPLASFSSVPFFHVADPDTGIAQLRRCLAVEGGHRLMGAYVPHVTVGLYADAWPVASVIQRLASFVSGDRIVCYVDKVCLMSYEPTVLGGALRCLAEFRFATQTLHWLSPVF